MRRYQLILRQYIRKRSDPIGFLFNIKFSRYAELSRGVPISFPNTPNFLDHLHLLEVRRENGDLVTSGTDGYCFIVTDTGITPEEAGKRVLGRIQQIRGLPWIYRNDLGVGETAKIRRLARFGYDVALA